MDKPIFSPAETMAWRYTQMRAARQTKVQPSQLCRRKWNAAKVPGDCYTVDSLGQAISYACKRAGVPKWTTYQLRHSAATRLAAQFGPEIAKIVLGHRDLGITRTYVLDDLTKAASVIEAAG